MSDSDIRIQIQSAMQAAFPEVEARVAHFYAMQEYQLGWRDEQLALAGSDPGKLLRARLSLLARLRFSNACYPEGLSDQELDQLIAATALRPPTARMPFAAVSHWASFNILTIEPLNLIYFLAILVFVFKNFKRHLLPRFELKSNARPG